MDAQVLNWVVDNGASHHCSAVSFYFANLKTSAIGTVRGMDCEVE
jgi:hypothetical protein